jgi:hypothetical protein
MGIDIFPVWLYAAINGQALLAWRSAAPRKVLETERG